MLIKMEDKIIKIFEGLRLSRNESQIYLDLIKYKKSSILEISKRTKIHRSNIYDCVRKLMDIGLISEVIEEKRKLIKILDPERILDYLKQKELDVKSILPYLKEYIFKTEMDLEDEVSVSKGSLSIKQEIMNLLEFNETIYVFSASEIFMNIFNSDFFKGFNDERIEKKINIKYMLNEKNKENNKNLNKLKFLEAKYLPKKYYSIVSICVCKEFLIFIIFSKPIHLIKIKNKYIAESYLKYFELLWAQSKPIF